MSKNYVYWIGVLPTDDRVTKKFRYGDFSWMEYSKKTWEYWCKENDVNFVHYDNPSRDDLIKYKVNWQRWLDVYDYIPDDYESILLVDASIMVKWDAPSYFDIYNDILRDHICAMRANENWRWTHTSAMGYADLFPEVEFVHKDYFCSGMVLFTREHEEMIKEFGQFYLDNHEEILSKEDETVKHGRDQPVLNYIVQKNNVPIHHWTIDRAVNHLYRRQILNGNWQMKQDMTPFFIKYFHAWQFSGFPDRGETRTQLMSQTWDLIKDKYK